MTLREEVNVDNVKRYVELDARRRALGQELEEIETGMGELSEEILADMLETATDKISLKDRALVKCSTRLFCFKSGGIEKEAFHELLRKHGYGDMVKEDFAWQTLTAMLKELRENGADFPDELLDACSVQLRSKLTVYPVKTKG